MASDGRTFVACVRVLGIRQVELRREQPRVRSLDFDVDVRSPEDVHRGVGVRPDRHQLESTVGVA